MASTLTEEQKKRIEENRRLALERRAAKLAEAERLKKTFSPAKPQPSNNFYKKPTITPNAPVLTKNVSPAKPPSLNSNIFYKKPDANSNTASAQSSNNHVPKPTASTNGWNKFNSSAPGSYQPLKFGTTKHTNTATTTGSSTSSSEPQRTWNVTTDALTGTVTLISRDRFVLDIGYNAKLVDLCKSIPGRIWDSDRKAWTFPLNEYEKFKKLTAPLSPQIVIGNLPLNIIKMFSNNWVAGVDYKTIDLSKIEPKLVSSLYPFQKEGVQFGISKSGRCLIADDMGLGKTIQALGIADYYRDEWPLLIVCPSSMRYQWEEEIRTHLPKVPSYLVYVLNTSKDTLERAKVVILSYDLMATKKDFLKNYGFGVAIMDECHSLKSIKAKRTKAALEILSKIRRAILLSGTPALSRPSELFTQIKALQPTLFKDMVEFGIRYCDGKQDKFGWNFNGSSNLEELKVILEEKIMIRRLKAHVLNQLPSKIRQVITIESEMNSKAMNAYANKLSNERLSNSDKRSTLLAYFQETGVAKVKAICKYIEQILAQDQKFLVFAHHKVVLDAICELLEANQTYYIRIDGSVSSEERKNVSDQFQEEKDYKVAVLSLKAANTGITLTAARLVIFAELFWNPGELIQAEDRAHRIGQESNVVIQYLLAKRTADDYLWPLIQGKLNILNQAGLTESTNLNVSETKNQTDSQQSIITDFFGQMDDDVKDEDLAELLDEIEGVQEKKIKLS